MGGRKGGRLKEKEMRDERRFMREEEVRRIIVGEEQDERIRRKVRKKMMEV